jgi:hypothetical protein
VIFGVISMIERGLDGKLSNHTNLLRTVIANSDVECILRAKNTPVNLTGESWWHDPRKIEKYSQFSHCSKQLIHLNQVVLPLLTAEKYRLRQQCIKTRNPAKDRHAVSGLSQFAKL